MAMMIETHDGAKVKATYVKHLRTLTPRNSMGGANRDLDLFRLADGSEVVAESRADDARDAPRIREDLTADSSMFAE